MFYIRTDQNFEITAQFSQDLCAAFQQLLIRLTLRAIIIISDQNLQCKCSICSFFFLLEFCLFLSFLHFLQPLLSSTTTPYISVASLPFLGEKIFLSYGGSLVPENLTPSSTSSIALKREVWWIQKSAVNLSLAHVYAHFALKRPVSHRAAMGKLVNT